jgi:hypothetical protein
MTDPQVAGGVARFRALGPGAVEECPQWPATAAVRSELREY